ncbi:MAG: hypothetical protein WAW41_00320 [Methylobacter sp.]
MTLPNISAADEYTGPQQTQASAISWAAIAAGDAEAALPLILLMLGTSLGLSSASTWAYSEEVYFRGAAQRSINCL